MIYIDRYRIPVPEFFNSINEFPFEKEIEYRLENLSKFSQSRFKLDNYELRRNVLKDLTSLFNHKCAYCENHVIKEEIEYFRPIQSVSGLKGDAGDGYYYLAYAWFNMYLVCYECQRYKSNYFPVKGKRLKPPSIDDFRNKETLFKYVNTEKPYLLDPCDNRSHKNLQFSYDENGNIHAESEKAAYTIDILKLNRSELLNARKDRIKELRHVISNINNFQGETNTPDILKGYLNDDQTFLGLNRYFISKEMSISRDVSDNTNLSENMTMSNKVYKDVSNKREKTLRNALIANIDSDLEKYQDPSLVYSFSKYIESIEIINFKCITHVKINIPRRIEGEGEQCLLLIGENGVGKSTILQAIAMATMGEDQLSKLNLGDYSNLIRRNAKKKVAKIIMSFLNETDPIEIEITPNSIKSNNKKLVKPTIGIGSVRRLPEDDEEVLFEDDPSRIMSLFRHDVVMPDIEPWLSDTIQVSTRLFNEAAKTIIDMLMLSEDVLKGGRLINRRSGKVTVNVGGGPEFIKNMCDGYRSVIGYALYIMRSLNVYWESAFNAEGLIVIDEIGNHLHPTWKIKVVSLLRKLFPHCTLIISTHDPLCLRAARKGEVWVMNLSEKDREVQLTQKDIPMGISLENLLIGEWFYMDHTTDEKTSKLIEDHALELFKEHPDIEKIKRIESQLEQTVLKTSSGISQLDIVLDFLKDTQNKNTIDLSKDKELRDKLAQRIRDQIKY